MKLIENLESRVLFSAGSIDTTFGNNGQISTPIGNDNPGITVLPDGKFITAGETVVNGRTSGSRMVIYNANGTVDRSVGDGGRVPLGFGGKAVTVDAVAGLPKGGILVAETASGGREYLIRFFADAARDMNFGVGGIVEMPKGSDTMQIKVDASGNIILAAIDHPSLPDGEVAFDGIFPLSLLRFSARGRPDKTFGASGIASTQFEVTNSMPSIQPLADGKIMVLGQLDVDTGGVARFNSDGTLDTSYGDDGIARVLNPVTGNILAGPPGGLGVTLAYIPPNISAQFQPDGSLIVALTFDGLYVSRITAQGVLDRSFGTLGFTSLPFTNTPIGVFVDPNGDSLILAQTLRSIVNQNESDNVGIAELTANGTLDSTFGNQGIVINDDSPEIGASSSTIDGSRVLVEPSVPAQKRLIVAAYST